jgi:hypothetical protein
MIKQNIATAIAESSEGIIAPEDVVPFIELVTRKLFSSREQTDWRMEIINGEPHQVKSSSI